jgi:hypothetical protein
MGGNLGRQHPRLPERGNLADDFTIRLSIDRFEGDKKQIAVPLAEDGTAIDFPEVHLPNEGHP